MKEMRVLVVGCGSIGRRHIQNLVALGVGKVGACDINKSKRDRIINEINITPYEDMEYAMEKDDYDVAFICSPPNLHMPQAAWLLERGMHCLIEKPLSHNLEGIDGIIDIADRKQKIVLIGYNLRYSPSLKSIKKLIDSGAIGNVLSVRASVGYYLPYMRPSEDYRKGYGASSEKGGGIVLDASHEIDYVRYLVGEVDEVSATCKKISALDIDTEDFAEITMRHESGAYSQIHLDYLQTNYRRNCEIIGDKGMIVWDLNERLFKLYGEKDKEYRVYYEGLNASVNDFYLEEIRHFIRCIEGVEEPLVDVREGKRLMEIIVKIKESSNEKRALKIG